MGLGGRGAFRNETRTIRMERLHGPKIARTAPALSEHEKEQRRAEALADRERYRREQSLKRRSPGD